MSLEDRLAGLVQDLPEGLSEGVALGTGIADGFVMRDSPLGEVVVMFNTRGVSAVDLADDNFATRFEERHQRSLIPADPPSSWSKHLTPAIEAGRPGRLPLDFRSLTEFQRRVLLEAATIPRGEVRSYGWLAQRINKPGAARAVGSTMASNPTPLIIPCHRVVRADGHMGEYSLGGPDNKWSLLESEGARPRDLESLADLGIRVQAHTGTGVFCHPSCSRLKSVPQERLRGFRSTAAAIEGGFRACKVCQPLG